MAHPPTSPATGWRATPHCLSCMTGSPLARPSSSTTPSGPGSRRSCDGGSARPGSPSTVEPTRPAWPWPGLAARARSPVPTTAEERATVGKEVRRLEDVQVIGVLETIVAAPGITSDRPRTTRSRLAQAAVATDARRYRSGRAATSPGLVCVDHPAVDGGVLLGHRCGLEARGVRAAAAQVRALLAA